jgi:3-deoxy-D-manno-octulosonate 8-phosphate phosphatase KdsC-like HAD superfamily phosphatase
VSSGIAADPAAMIGGNAYATTKAALEAHTINLAAELAGSGVTDNVYRVRARPGGHGCLRHRSDLFLWLTSRRSPGSGGHRPPRAP